MRRATRFPTNLDRDEPIDGLAPSTQADVLRRAVRETWEPEALTGRASGPRGAAAHRMRAAVFAGVGVLSIEERPQPVLAGSDDVLIRVLACGLCGTDVHILSDPPGHPATAGVVLGHEFVGSVVATGSAVGSVAVGDRIAVRPILTCGKCRPCRSGAANHCARMDAIGVYRNGGLATHVVAPESACIPIDPSIPVHIAALTEPLACVLNALGRAQPLPGEQVVIIGAGRSACCSSPCCARREPGASWSSSRRRRAARWRTGWVRTRCSIPARAPCRPPCQSSCRTVPALSSTPSDPSSRRRCRSPRAAPGSCCSGLTRTPSLPSRQSEITQKELSILGSYVGQDSFPDAIRLLESGTLDLAPIVSHVGDLDQLPELLEALRGGNIVKAVITL